MAIEQFSNGASSPLTATITAVQTSFDVVDATVYAQRAPFRVRLDQELMLIGAVSGNTLSSITRPIEGSLAGTHAAGTPVIQGVTAGALRSLGHVGRASIVVPTVSMFTGLNMVAGSSVAEDEAGVLLTAPAKGSGHNVIGQYMTAPTPPYSVTAFFSFNAPFKSLIGFGMLWRSSGGTLATFDTLGIDGETAEMSARKANSPTSYNSGYVFLRHLGWVQWMRLRDDGTNRKCLFSADGLQWLEFSSVARTDFLTPIQIGWQVYNANNATPNFGCQLRLLSWDVTLG